MSKNQSNAKIKTFYEGKIKTKKLFEGTRVS